MKPISNERAPRVQRSRRPSYVLAALVVLVVMPTGRMGERSERDATAARTFDGAMPATD